MFKCLLRVSGKNLKVEEVIRNIKLPYHLVFKKGELKYPSLNKSRINQPNKSSGFSCVIGRDNDKTIKQYVRDAIRFLKKHRSSLTKICSRQDIELMTIDFGLESRLSKTIAAQFDYIPPELVKLAAKHNIGFEVSNYSGDAINRAVNSTAMNPKLKK